MQLSANQVMTAIETWLNDKILKTPVSISDFSFSGYGSATNVNITLKDKDEAANV